MYISHFPVSLVLEVVQSVALTHLYSVINQRLCDIYLLDMLWPQQSMKIANKCNLQVIVINISAPSPRYG